MFKYRTKICKFLVSNQPNINTFRSLKVGRGSELQLQVGENLNYCRSGNIREVSIFARRSNSRIPEFREKLLLL